MFIPVPKTFMVLHVIHMKSDSGSCVRELEREAHPLYFLTSARQPVAVCSGWAGQIVGFGKTQYWNGVGVSNAVRLSDKHLI